MILKFVEITVKKEFEEIYHPDRYHHVAGVIEDESDETETHVTIRPFFWTKREGSVAGSLTRYVKDHIAMREFHRLVV